MSAAPELKATLTLPQTAFPMKANLPHNEPLRLARWASLRLYEELRKAGRGRPAYILHDGPPYANGPIHLGHALNKGLKDFVVKSKTMAGYDAPYVPGYDCHGLPIEIKVDEKLGRKKREMPVPAVLEACRAYAQKYVNLQTEQFQRIGCFGRWQRPYRTMSRDYEARTLEAFYGFLEKGFVYRGLKPVYWCIHDRTALAEAEVEYEMHTSPSVYVRYALTSDPAAIHPALAGKNVSTIISTTTPWTLTASLAVAFHPDFDYVALAAGGSANAPVYIVAAELAAQVAEACKLGPTTELARFKGSILERTTYQHPFLDRSILGVLATYVTADAGTGAVHTAPSHGADDFYTGLRYNLDPTCRVDAGGHIHVDPAAWHEASPPPFDGLNVWAANPVIIDLLKQSGALLDVQDLDHSYPHCWRCHHPVIFRATEQWFISMETPLKRPNGIETTFRQLTIEEIDKVVWDPDWGKERITNMIASRPDWCISRQRIWGVPIAVFLCEACNQPIIDHDLNKQDRRSLRARRRRGLAHHRCRPSAPSRSPMRWLRRHKIPQGNRHSRRMVRLRRQLVCRLRVRPRPEDRLCVLPKRKGHGVPLSRGRRPASRLVPLISAHLGGSARPRALLPRRHRRLDPRRAGPRHVQIPRQRRRSGRYRQPHGRRNRPSLGRLGRLPRGHGRQREPNAALRRPLPQAAQHLPFPPRQPARLRSGPRPCPRGRACCPWTVTCSPAPATSPRRSSAGTRPSSSIASIRPSTSSPSST